MSPYNVAVVLAPCLLRSLTPTMMDIQYAGHLVVFINKLIENFWDVFGDKEKQEKVFRKSIKRTEKMVQRRLSLGREGGEGDEEIEKEI